MADCQHNRNGNSVSNSRKTSQKQYGSEKIEKN